MTSSIVTTRTFSPVLGVGFDIRIVTIGGEPWFVAADVCRALGMDVSVGTGQWLTGLTSEQKQQVVGKSHVTPEMNSWVPEVVGLRPGVKITVISESGLYKLVLRSDKPQARPFQDWVTRDVLPTIRKTGSYVMGEASISLHSDPRHAQRCRPRLSRNGPRTHQERRGGRWRPSR